MRRAKFDAGTSDDPSSTLNEQTRPHRRVPVAVIVVCGLLLGVVGFYAGRYALASVSGRMVAEKPTVVRVASGDALASAAATGGASAGGGMVEVPHLVGLSAQEAAIILQTAGLHVAFVASGTPAAEASRAVEGQDPDPGRVISVDSTVTLIAPPSSGASEAVAPVTKKRAAVVVCIDPGHQAHTDVKLEPVGPGSKREKPRATGGSTGVSSGLAEYELALQISMNLKRRLEAEGFKVVMTRTTNDVRISNGDRARMANRAKARLFVRVHAGVSTDPAMHGVSTVYPGSNGWTHAIVGPSKTAATLIGDALASATGSTNLGVRQEAGLAGFNWSKVPVVMVETGYLSNPVEDKLLASPNYQDKISEGLAEGIQAYLSGSRP